MLATKHTDIAKLIRNSIKEGKYTEKLPGVRKLSAEYDVSPKTVLKALKPLVAEGLIIPSAQKGNIISSKSIIRPKTGIIGIFCSTENPDLKNDLLLREIIKAIENDGYRALFMSVPDPHIFQEEVFWKSAWIDGYIFTYSSLKKELAYILKRNEIPFVTANRLPDECGASWVDFDQRNMFEEMAKKLSEAGCKTAGSCTFIHQQPVVRKYYRESYIRAMKKYDLYVPEYFVYEEEPAGLENFNQKEYLDFVKKQVEYYLSLKKLPDAIWLDLFSPQPVIDEFRKAGVRIPEDLKVIIKQDVDKFNDNGLPTILYSYNELAFKTWELFKEQLDNVNLCAHKEITCKFVNF